MALTLLKAIMGLKEGQEIVSDGGTFQIAAWPFGKEPFARSMSVLLTDTFLLRNLPKPKMPLEEGLEKVFMRVWACPSDSVPKQWLNYLRNELDIDWQAEVDRQKELTANAI